MIKLTNLKVPIDTDLTAHLQAQAEAILGRPVTALRIIKKAVDARRLQEIHYVCSISVACAGEEDCLKHIHPPKGCILSKAEPYCYHFPKNAVPSAFRPIIVGTGPAGLFAGLVLAQNGFRPILLERGRDVDSRTRDVSAFWNGGPLSSQSNVQFGEGGAGTFSDGKLTTGIKDERIRKVLEEFVIHGAPEEILYLAKPHIGTDKLKTVVKNIRREIISLGGEVRFENTLTDLIIEDNRLQGCIVQSRDNGLYTLQADRLLLATGHSARDTFQMLQNRRIPMEQKTFAIGARIEHPQELISKSQYGRFASVLPAADYKLAVHLDNGRSLYTFCMCPGGYVVNSASEPQQLVTNGMSNFRRDGKNANSALLVNVFPQDLKSTDPLAGIALQREIEHAAFTAGGGSYRAPAQLVKDFLKNVPSQTQGHVSPTFLPGVVWSDLRAVLPGFITETMAKGLLLMDKKLRGFASPDAVLTAPETRSSSPVRIIRDRITHETPVQGLFSAGEGGGHAGGITSAAVDGMKTAEQMFLKA